MAATSPPQSAAEGEGSALGLDADQAAGDDRADGREALEVHIAKDADADGVQAFHRRAFDGDGTGEVLVEHQVAEDIAQHDDLATAGSTAIDGKPTEAGEMAGGIDDRRAVKVALDCAKI